MVSDLKTFARKGCKIAAKKKFVFSANFAVLAGFFWYQCYYLHRSRDSLYPVWGIFFLHTDGHSSNICGNITVLYNNKQKKVIVCVKLYSSLVFCIIIDTFISIFILHSQISMDVIFISYSYWKFLLYTYSSHVLIPLWMKLSLFLKWTQHSCFFSQVSPLTFRKVGRFGQIFSKNLFWLRLVSWKHPKKCSSIK